MCTENQAIMKSDATSYPMDPNVIKSKRSNHEQIWNSCEKCDKLFNKKINLQRHIQYDMILVLGIFNQ